MLEILQYAFMQRALLGGIAIALACALLGPFLVLRRLSLLGDGLAHVAFGGVAFGLLLGFDPLLAALVATIVGALVIQRLISHAGLYGDSATAVLLSFGVGSAIIFIGLAQGFTVDLFSYLFGSILVISFKDLFIIFAVLIAVLIFIIAFYKKLVFMSFQENLAKLNGIHVNWVNSIFAVLVAATVVISIRAVGILLVSALLVIPAVSALAISSSFRRTMVFSAIFGVLSVVLGIIISFLLNLPPSGAIVILMCLFFVGALIWNKD
jgi:zinc transport system permease protein